MTTETYTYNPSVTPGLDQLTSKTASGTTTSYTYTSDGQLKTRGADTLSWDGNGRHTGGTFGGTSVSYGFDPLGFRRSRIGGGVTTRYLLDGTFETSDTGVLSATDIPGPDGDLAHYSGAPSTSVTVRYQYYDNHGNLAAEADQSGARLGAYTYDPFGALRSGSAPANSTSERWVADHNKKLDTTSGLIEMGARPYDPSLGRFLAPDPVEGGSANAYDYANQDPINTFDYDGTEPIPKGACEAYRYYIHTGNLTPNQAAGIVGNLWAESHLSPWSGYKTSHQGIAQWSTTRWAKLVAYANKKHKYPYSRWFQITYVLTDLKNNYKGTWQQLREDKSIYDATFTIFDEYEHPGDNSLGKRVEYATRIRKECSID